jgi:hypothetical protein
MELEEVHAVFRLGVDTVDAEAEAVLDKHSLEVLYVDYSSHFEAGYLSAGERYQQDIDEWSMEAHLDVNRVAAVAAAEERTSSWEYRYNPISLGIRYNKLDYLVLF